MGTHTQKRNSTDLTEAGDIKKREQEYKELYNTDLKDSENHDGVGTHLGPDILVCEVKWAFSSVQFSHSVVSDSWQPDGLHHARPPCPSPTPGAYSNSCPSSR